MLYVLQLAAFPLPFPGYVPGPEQAEIHITAFVHLHLQKRMERFSFFTNQLAMKMRVNEPVMLKRNT
ncbi:MAG: hypothetical protein CME32_24095 [Gimesia sp.]|nr:hypothetical protein [Gimesia sp.]